MDFDKCSTLTTDSKIVVQEKRSKFEVINKDRLEVYKVQVDGCLITGHQERCDWIISIEQGAKAMFIELKGCHLDKAIAQLKSTLVHTKKKYQGYTRECYAITTRVPKHGASARKQCLKFHKETGVTLSIKNLRTTVKI